MSGLYNLPPDKVRALQSGSLSQATMVAYMTDRIAAEHVAERRAVLIEPNDPAFNWPHGKYGWPEPKS